MRTEQKINEAIRCLQNVPLINCGGCGIAALAIARYVHKVNPKIKIKFGFLGDYATDEDGVRAAPCHVVVLWGIHRVDAEGFDSPLAHHWDVTEEVTESDLVKSINDVDSWNSMFDRTKQVREIESELGIDLSDVVTRNPRW